MPINKIPIIENSGKREDKATKSIKKEIKEDFYITEPKYDLSEVILSEIVKKEIDRIVSYLKYHDTIFNE